jgi:hypothetical protein
MAAAEAGHWWTIFAQTCIAAATQASPFRHADLFGGPGKTSRERVSFCRPELPSLDQKVMAGLGQAFCVRLKTRENSKITLPEDILAEPRRIASADPLATLPHGLLLLWNLTSRSRGE